MSPDFLAWPLAALFNGGGVLRPTCAPGGNFALEHWNLQLPVGNSRGTFETKPSQALQGCRGWSDHMFYTDAATGYMVLTAPGNPNLTGCVTTPGSFHCRTELREVDALTGRQMAWSPSSSKNILRSTMKVVRADDGYYSTVIGQVFASWPLVEMFYSLEGELVLGIKPG